MIHSLFIANITGDIFLEKHWKKVVTRSVCDHFYEEVTKAGSSGSVPPVIKTPHHYLINILKNDVYYIAVTMEEVSPLFVIEFLYRVVEVIQSYFSSTTETVIKDNIVQLYEILDEMLDNGFPLATELNILHDLIRPPTLFRALADSVTGRRTGIGAKLPTGQLSNIPWRRADAKYVSNEAYFDVTEEIDAIIDRTGNVIMAEVQGYIDCHVKLSGVPDLQMTFINPRLIDDASFHPCVRYKRWEDEKLLSFVPPDGDFRLMSYSVTGVNALGLPLTMRAAVSYREMNSRLEFVLSARQSNSKALEDVRLSTELPKSALNVSLTPSTGRYTFNSVSKELIWEVGKIDSSQSPSLKGSIDFQKGLAVPESNPNIELSFSIRQHTVSGLRVNRLDVRGEKYKPYKGVKYSSKAGKYQIRT